MKVILLESVANLGIVGDIVNVKPGYARNLLLPRGKAIVASDRSLKHSAHQKMMLEHKLKRARKRAEDVKEAMESKGVTIRRKAGAKDKLFGSVTSLDIEEALRAQGVIVNRKTIHLEEPIKKVGVYQVGVKLEGGLEAKIKVEVEPERS